MNGEPWICDVCKRDIPEGAARVKKAKAKREFTQKLKMECDKFCAACYSKLKAMNRKRPVGMFFTAVKSDLDKIAVGYMPPDSMDNLAHIEHLIHETEVEIKILIGRIEKANRSLNVLKRFNTDLSHAIGDYLWRSYPERRKRANSIISKIELRIMVFSRDGWKCVRCSRTSSLTIDHILPVAKNGTDEPENLQTLCRSCNSKKGASVE